VGKKRLTFTANRRASVAKRAFYRVNLLLAAFMDQRLSFPIQLFSSFPSPQPSPKGRGK
jgi:hypothetical protein